MTGHPALAERVRSGRPVVLDGGLATLLEARGHDLSGGLWSARLLATDPQALVRAHAEFRAAGAEVATTASYQATFEGLGAVGVGHAEAARLLRRSVELAREAMGEDGWVAASVGPYGAMLADGSEYSGRYGLPVAALRAFHHERLGVLVEAGPDLVAYETVPCLAEAEALVAEAAGLGVPAWLSLTCTGDRLRSGEPAADAFALARGVAEVVAVGVNCTAPEDAAGLVATAVKASGKPAVVYPNSGESWDGVAARWVGDPGFDPAHVRRWLADGARLVGGCCRVGPAQVAAVAAAVRGWAGRDRPA